MNYNKYGLLGYPLQQSLSPSIHRYFDPKVDYELFPVKVEDLENTLHKLRKELYGGFNVTTPHKKSIIPLLNELDPLAERLEAVNTVLITAEGFYGYNTDYSGFKESFPFADLSDMDVMIFGSGGAARAVTAVLADLNVSQIYLVNRDMEKAERLAARFNGSNTRISVMSYSEELKELSPQIMINATTADNPCKMRYLPQEDNLKLLYDLNYLRGNGFCEIYAHRDDILRQDGLLMLIIQAAYARKIWGHPFPDVQNTERYLRCIYA